MSATIITFLVSERQTKFKFNKRLHLIYLLLLIIYVRITKYYVAKKGSGFTLKIEKPEADLTTDLLTR